MTGFHDVSLPLAWTLGARGGPERRTDIVALGSGREARSSPWRHGRRRYDLGGGAQSLDALRELVAFFEARRGQLYGFRFRDLLDMSSATAAATPAPGDQQLGIGDGVQRSFGLVKRYGVGEAAYDRPIRKPVAGSVRVAVNGAETTSFTLNAGTGVVTFAAAPAAGAVITAGFVFDTPVRFDTPRLEIALDGASSGRALAAPLVEVLI